MNEGLIILGDIDWYMENREAYRERGTFKKKKGENQLE